MKAARATRYGPADVIRIEEGPTPVLGTGEVLDYMALHDQLSDLRKYQLYQLGFANSIMYAGLEADDVVTLPPAVEECLYRIAIEALNNALKHACAARITVSLRQTKDELDLSISDDGVGIKSDIVEKIFDPFFTTKPVGKGTGLGLHIVNGIVRNHGGEIVLESVPGFVSEFVTVKSENHLSQGIRAKLDAVAADTPGASGTLDLVPWPKSVQTTAGALGIGPGTRIVYANAALLKLLGAGDFESSLPDVSGQDNVGSRLQAGVSFGGPLKEDRAFYFVAYEHQAIDAGRRRARRRRRGRCCAATRSPRSWP